MQTLGVHGQALAAEMAWLRTVIRSRLSHFFSKDKAGALSLPKPPPIDPTTAYGRLAVRTDLDPSSRLCLALALAPSINPSLLDPFHTQDRTTNARFSEFGIITGRTGGAIPTAQTALFLLSGDDISARALASGVFAAESPLAKHGLIWLEPQRNEILENYYLLGILTLRPDLAAELATGKPSTPTFSPTFPAHELTTPLQWKDLVLGAHTIDQLEHILTWLQYEDRITKDWGLSDKIAPGYRALFYGPSGTGKTLTATLLGKITGRSVFRVDLSSMVSKYIGETEKNLATVFDQAELREWILFFDEADALFGKRSTVSTANDRYANQEVSYLLQRIESSRTLVILATNLRGNIDDAFNRRFQSLIGFTRPTTEERERLWKNVFDCSTPVASDVNLTKLAEEYDLVGGAIVNIARFAAVNALRNGEDFVSAADISAGIASEIRKEGRTP